jgi:hypothetical protein
LNFLEKITPDEERFADIELSYTDDKGRKLTPKEAFRQLSYKFHGKKPGKNRLEKLHV